jgi:hypothetical protein
LILKLIYWILLFCVSLQFFLFKYFGIPISKRHDTFCINFIE